MEQPKYKKLVEMGKDRIKYVQDQTQGESKPCGFIREKYSEENFVELYGSQDKKAIKLATFREINRTPVAKAIVFIFHSLGMHSGTTAHLAERLAKEGYIAVAFDQRGHGKSEGEKGYLDSWKDILKDCCNFVKKVTDLYPSLPYFYFGHGAGALMSITLAKEKKEFKVSGLIVANPSLKKPESSKVLSAISGFALKVMPNRAGLFAFNFNNLSRNPNASSVMLKDPLMYHEKVFVGTLLEMQEMM
jgi:alpha-beta hydrolase superfamily lysophospholipase